MGAARNARRGSRRETSNITTTRNAHSAVLARQRTALFFVRAAIAQLQEVVRALSPNPIDNESNTLEWDRDLAAFCRSERKANGKRKSRVKSFPANRP